MEKIVLRNNLSPGDVCVMTTAVKMLAQQHGDKFELGYTGTASELFRGNPHISGFKHSEGRELRTNYPLIHKCGERPVHFIQGYIDYLADELRVPLELTQNYPDIHLTKREISSAGPLYKKVGIDFPYWLLCAGGKSDYTLKHWVQHRWQELVDKFEGKICFVQIGLHQHTHPPLKNVIDFRGTTIRQLIELMYHSQGVVCPVTFPMHLSAGVPTKTPALPKRPCVVIAGGREPLAWEMYPWHRHIHTTGALPCCPNNGCWASREGDCELPVEIPESPDRIWPRCMDMISTDRVASEILSYFVDGYRRYLTPEEFKILKPHLNEDTTTDSDQQDLRDWDRGCGELPDPPS